MKKKVSRAINKNLKIILVAAAIIAVGFGVLLMLISGNSDDRDKVVTDQVEQQQEKQKDRKQAKQDDHPGVSEEALDLYNARADKIDDTAAVAQLTEAMDLKKNVGDYMVTLQITEDEKGMLITFSMDVYENEKKAVDANIEMCAQRLLALISDADKVQWTYTLTKDGKTEAVEGSLTTKQASEKLKLKIKEYGESPEMVQTLLNSQKGIT